MNGLERHSAEVDCRGAGAGKKLSSPNKILVTRTYPEGGAEPVAIEVSCFYLNSVYQCRVTGAQCPHLYPVTRVA
jgi:hypothetical protein